VNIDCGILVVTRASLRWVGEELDVKIFLPQRHRDHRERKGKRIIENVKCNQSRRTRG